MQAYGKRALDVIDWVAATARECGRRMTVRLVKGAYWDTEIKRAQERGLDGYPVFTRKVTTDVSYLACAGRLFSHIDVIYPQFATHNAHSIASVLELAPDGADYRISAACMAWDGLLYAEAARQITKFPRVRVYAPVGEHKDLLAYLVRRLLENGANTSFVNRFMDEQVAVAEIVRDPISELERLDSYAHARLPVPACALSRPPQFRAASIWAIRPTSRRCARKYRFAGRAAGRRAAGRADRQRDIAARRHASGRQSCGPARSSSASTRDATPRRSSAASMRRRGAGRVGPARRGGPGRDCSTGPPTCSKRAAPIFMICWCARRARPCRTPSPRCAKPWISAATTRCKRAPNSAAPERSHGPTGELNELSLHGRGVFACISPWNFPLAIFAGQVTAALAAGNTVVAKPAEPTPLIAARFVKLLHEAGVPPQAVHLMPAPGRLFGEVAFAHAALAGVAMTGSTATALTINRSLAARSGAIVPLIAETGGLNAMIVDSTALPEQVVDDVVSSAFMSAGQRCSALRLLFLQDDIADQVLEMIAGAMDELVIGDPSDFATDLGPVITAAAADGLGRHVERMRNEARIVKACRLGEAHANGSFFAPHLIELKNAPQLTREEFGPVLHVVRYRSADIGAGPGSRSAPAIMA